MPGASALPRVSSTDGGGIVRPCRSLNEGPQCLTIVSVRKNELITFRLPADLKAAAIRAAEADHRSVGQLCTLLLAQHLERIGEWPPERATTRKPSRAGGRARRA